MDLGRGRERDSGRVRGKTEENRSVGVQQNVHCVTLDMCKREPTQGEINRGRKAESHFKKSGEKRREQNSGKFKKPED